MKQRDRKMGNRGKGQKGQGQRGKRGRRKTGWLIGVEDRAEKRKGSKDWAGGWRGGNGMGVRHEKTEMKRGKGRRIRGGEHRLVDPDSQGSQNTFFIKESQIVKLPG